MKPDPYAYRPGLKGCARCRQWLDPSEFDRAAHTKDRLQGWCRRCMREYVRDWKRRKKILRGTARDLSE